jgi:hypothetical protein
MVLAAIILPTGISEWLAAFFFSLRSARELHFEFLLHHVEGWKIECVWRALPAE